MTRALIGYTGFVGSTLLRQLQFDRIYRSADIQDIKGKSFDLVVCAGAPAQKWIANANPDADRRNIEQLIGNLRTVECGLFVLISTVDVYDAPAGVDEDRPIVEGRLHPYGLHRRLLERFVQEHYRRHLVVRLPGLVGPGLRKNVIFDLLNDNNLGAIDSRSVYQFYPTINLWPDIEAAVNARMQLVHLTAEPISVAEVSRRAFHKDFEHHLPSPPANYDFRTRYAHLFGGTGHYQYSKRESILAIRAYVQTEPRSLRGSEPPR